MRFGAFGRIRHKSPGEVSRSFRSNVFDALSIRLSLGRLRPRRAVFHFTSQINDSTETIFEHPSHASKKASSEESVGGVRRFAENAQFPVSCSATSNCAVIRNRYADHSNQEHQTRNLAIAEQGGRRASML